MFILLIKLQYPPNYLKKLSKTTFLSKPYYTLDEMIEQMLYYANKPNNSENVQELRQFASSRHGPTTSSCMRQTYKVMYDKFVNEGDNWEDWQDVLRTISELSLDITPRDYEFQGTDFNVLYYSTSLTISLCNYRFYACGDGKRIYEQ